MRGACRARGVPRPSCAERGSRCVPPGGVRSGDCRSSRSRTPSSRSRATPCVASARGCAASRRSRSSASSSTSRAFRSASSASTSPTSRRRRRSGRWSSSRTRCPRRRTTASSDHARKGQDDFAMMARGRVAALRAAPSRTSAASYDEGFAAVPNLVVIDGGKGQLSAALAAMQQFDLPRVAVIALAKQRGGSFRPGRADPIVLDRGSAGLQLLQRIRDEAHRFALGFHRQRRDKAVRGVDPRRACRASVPPQARAHRSTSARRNASWRRPRRSSRACPACPRRRGGRSTRRCTGQAAHSEHAARFGLVRRLSS